MADVELSPLPSDQVRSIVILLAREGQAAISNRNAPAFAAECFEAAASLARDYATPQTKEEGSL